MAHEFGEPILGSTLVFSSVALELELALGEAINGVS
jgi:hypothetical protein